ncbi:sensor histidine kinase [Roseburia sp. OM04-10BH]|nr:sensor histidine kinase [Roseburia sp. OM04-10BH]RHV39636.1 sensor histidine kinase [Roseburia sp. OM04-15AA]
MRLCMIQDSIRWFFNFLCSFYLFYKLLNLKNPKILQKISFFIIFLIDSFLFCFLEANSFIFIFPTIILFNTFILSRFTQKTISLSLVTLVISEGIHYILFLLAALLTALVIAPFFYGRYDLPYVAIQFTGGLLELLLIFLLFKIKRLRRGMPFLYQIGSSATGFILSCFILLIVTIISFYDSIPDMQFLFLLIALFLIGLLLYCWWRFRITRDYREKLRQAELKALQNELIEKDNRIRKLEENNDALAKIIHKDNKLIPAMELAVCEYLEDGITDGDTRKKGEQLSNELKTMAQDRKGTLNSYRHDEHSLPVTGVCVLDALFTYMQQRALAQNINFSLHITGNIVKMTEDVISGEDLSHLLADLLENAMIAIGDNEVRSLSAYLCHNEDSCTIEISDSGNAFDVQLFEDFGQTRHTTHKDSGGSGIGLMDIWKIKKQYCASLHIIEYAPGTSTFTKKISLVFDRKNHYLIQTYRRNEIERVHIRNDMFVLQSD